MGLPARSRWWRAGIAVAAMLAAVVSSLPAAFAYDETTTTIPPASAANCGTCHYPYPAAIHLVPFGPHGAFGENQNQCRLCHMTHVAWAGRGEMLLVRDTITDSCNTCHDGTGGRGVYGTLAARGLNVGAQHRTETTNSVPGGSASTGDTGTTAFAGQDGTLTCTDCHSVHGTHTVAPFQGDRERLSGFPQGVVLGGVYSNRLLKTRPGDASVETTQYGSDWCLACHKGRGNATALHNHPVEASSAVADPYTYGNLPMVAVEPIEDWPFYQVVSTGTVEMGQLGGINNAYLMPDTSGSPTPRAPIQRGHFPICQQCHEDPRDVGTLSVDGSVATPAEFVITQSNGMIASDNPRVQNFPHEASTTAMLVESANDLCLNCHSAGALP
jgi:hypothetical protein